MKIRAITILIPLALTVAGCASYSPLESQFGDSVRLVTSKQTSDAGAALYPASEATEGSDAYRLENVIEAHRADVSKPEQVNQPVTISVGGGNR